MANSSKYITTIEPTTNIPCELMVFKHENGGYFAIDGSFTEQCFEDDEDVSIPDPFNSGNTVTLNGI